jgi:hypothetical protein
MGTSYVSNHLESLEVVFGLLAHQAEENLLRAHHDPHPTRRRFYH